MGIAGALLVDIIVAEELASEGLLQMPDGPALVHCAEVDLAAEHLHVPRRLHLYEGCEAKVVQPAYRERDFKLQRRRQRK